MSQTISKRRQAKLERQRQARRERLITFSVIGAIVIVFLGVLIYSQINPSAPAISELRLPEGLTRPVVADNTAGLPNAPVKVEEFSDFQCIHCRAFWQESEARLLNEYVSTGKVHFTYSTLPVINQNSGPIAEAAYCAMDQGKFWEYHDLLFANYDLGFGRDRLEAYADHLDLDLREFRDCLQSRKHQDRINQEVQRAQSLGVSGTPTFIVNGQLTNRAQLFEVIEAALANQ